MLKLNHFNKYGYAIFEGCVEEKICELIKEKVLRSKNFDKKIFLNKEEFEKKKPNAFNKNPRPGSNLVDNFDDFEIFLPDFSELIMKWHDKMTECFALHRPDQGRHRKSTYGFLMNIY